MWRQFKDLFPTNGLEPSGYRHEDKNLSANEESVKRDTISRNVDDEGKREMVKKIKKRSTASIIVFSVFIILATLASALAWTLAHSPSIVEICLLVLLLLALAAPLVFLATGGFSERTHCTKRLLFNARFDRGKIDQLFVPWANSFNQDTIQKQSELTRQSGSYYNEWIDSVYNQVATRWIAWTVFVLAWIAIIFLAINCFYSFLQHVIVRNEITGQYVIDLENRNFLWTFDGTANTEALIGSFLILQILIVLSMSVWFYMFSSAQGESEKFTRIMRDVIPLSLAAAAAGVNIFLGFTPDWLTGVLCIAQAVGVVAFWLVFGLWKGIIAVLNENEETGWSSKYTTALLQLMRMQDQTSVLYADALAELYIVSDAEVVQLTIQAEGKMNTFAKAPVRYRTAGKPGNDTTVQDPIARALFNVPE